MTTLYILLLLILFIFLFFFITLFNKEVVFLISISLLGFIPFLRLGPSPEITHFVQTGIILLIFLVVVIKLFINGIKTKQPKINIGFFKQEVILLLLFIILFGTIGILNNNQLSNVLGQMIVFIEYLLFYFITVNIIHESKVEKIFDNYVNIYVLFTLFAFIMVFLGLFPANTVNNDQETRIVLGIPFFSWVISVYYINKFLINNKIKYLFIACFFTTLLFISYFRSYWLGFLGSIVFLLTYNFIRVKRRKFYKNLALLLIIILLSAISISFYVLYAQPEFFSYTIERIISAIMFNDPSVLTRVEEIKTLMYLISEKPILGYGLGAEYEVYSYGQAGIVSKNYIHNIVLFLLYKTGIVGFLIVFLIIISIFIKAIKQTLGGKNALIPSTILSIIFGLIIAAFAEPEIINFLYTPFIGFFVGIVSKTITNQKGKFDGKK